MRYLILACLLAGCGNTITTNTVIQEAPKASLTASKSSTPMTYAPHAFTGSNCWIDNVRTNGPSYGAADNSVYRCTGGGGDYGAFPPGSSTTDIGFYQDGTVSFKDPSGSVDVMTVSLRFAANCVDVMFSSGGLWRYDMTAVNYTGYPTTLLDSRNQLQYVEAQRFRTPNDLGTLDSGSIWTCQLVNP